MRTKYLSGAALVFASAFVASATPLTFELRDGSSFEIPSENLEMTFAGTMLNTSFNGGTREIPVSEISSFYFYAIPTSISDEILEENPEAEVYGVDGRSYGRYVSVEEAKASLPKGLYVIKYGSKTIKTAVR